MGFTVSHDFAQPVGRVFDYLADPRNRPAWQASLRGIELLTEGEPGIGTRWYDVTWPGPRPLMEITDWQRNLRWVELGRWRGLEVTLDLLFTPTDVHRTRVRATTETRAPGWRRGVGRWLGRGLDLVGPLAARDDLRRAARLC